MDNPNLILSFFILLSWNALRKIRSKKHYLLLWMRWGRAPYLLLTLSLISANTVRYLSALINLIFDVPSWGRSSGNFDPFFEQIHLWGKMYRALFCRHNFICKWVNYIPGTQHIWVNGVRVYHRLEMQVHQNLEGVMLGRYIRTVEYEVAAYYEYSNLSGAPNCYWVQFLWLKIFFVCEIVFHFDVCYFLPQNS